MERVKFKNIIFFIILWGAIALLAAIALIALFRSGPVRLQLPFYAGFGFLAAALFAIILIYKLNILSRLNTTAFIIILLIITIIPRFTWIYIVQTQPFSDFLHMHNYGVNASKGDFKGFVDFYAVFPFKIGFGLILAGLYKLFGTSLLVAKLFNVALSAILVFIIYAGGRMLYSEKAGRIAAILCALWPAQIMYTSVIAAEHLFLVLFTASVVLILKFIKKYTFKNYEVNNGNFLLIAAAILTAFAQLIRPMAMILLPVFAVFVLLYKRYRSNMLNSIGLCIKSIILFTAVYFLVINLVNLPIQKASGVDVTKSGSGFNLMIGTNSKSDGMFNYEDFKIIEKNNYDFDKVHQEAKQIAIDRIKSDPEQLIKLVIRKYEIMWGDENFGYYWSTISAQNSEYENIIKSHPRVFYAVSQAFYILIVLMALGSCLYALSERRYDVLVILMIFGGIVVSYTLLEVQSRYHLPVMPLLILFGASFADMGKRYEI